MPIGGAIGGAISGGLGLLGASNASNAANKQNQANIAPWLKAGQGAIQNLSNPNSLMKNFYTSPNYKFTLQQGLNAVGTDKAVNGLLRSGGAIKSLNNYAQGEAAGQFNNYVGQQQFISQQGTQAAAGANASNTTNSTNQGNIDLGAGNLFGNLAGSLAKYSQPTAGTGSSYG